MLRVDPVFVHCQKVGHQPLIPGNKKILFNYSKIDIKSFLHHVLSRYRVAIIYLDLRVTTAMKLMFLNAKWYDILLFNIYVIIPVSVKKQDA